MIIWQGGIYDVFHFNIMLHILYHCMKLLFRLLQRLSSQNQMYIDVLIMWYNQMYIDVLIMIFSSAFGDNPLYCDCNLKWLSDFIKKDFIESGTATCTGPKTMINQKLLTSESFNFECFGKLFHSNEIRCRCTLNQWSSMSV